MDFNVFNNLATPSVFKLLLLLIFCAMFDHSSYSKYEFKYAKLEVLFQFSLVIKQIIKNYMIIFIF
jgi:hypothetical protein